MAKKPELDLQNGHIGGRPKDWLEKAHEGGDEAWLGDLSMLVKVVLILLLLVGGAVGFLYGIAKLTS